MKRRTYRKQVVRYLAVRKLLVARLKGSHLRIYTPSPYAIYSARMVLKLRSNSFYGKRAEDIQRPFYGGSVEVFHEGMKAKARAEIVAGGRRILYEDADSIVSVDY